jgi:carbon-monoxide dehydrogenase medium subunit
VMVTLGATCYLESRAGGVRAVPAEEFFLSYYTSALRQDELLTWVRVPRPRARQGWGFAEVARRHGDFAMAGAAAVVELGAGGAVRAVRAGLMAAGETPLLMSAPGAADATAGQLWDEQLWEGQRRDGQRRDGQRRDGQRWDGQRWDGQRWDGQRWDERRWDGLAAAWTAELDFSEDPEYARALARVALRRALVDAAERAGAA